VIEKFRVQVSSLVTITAYVIRTCIRQTAVQDRTKCTCSAVACKKSCNLYSLLRWSNQSGCSTR